MEVINVQWFPSHPQDQGGSMKRYYRELAACARRPGSGCRVRSPYPVPESLDKNKNRWTRAWARYVAYPWVARTWTRPGLAHILDHSSAQIIPWIRRDCRLVATVHDLAPLCRPQEVQPHQYRRYRKQMQQLHRCEHLIAVSAYTKATIVEHLGFDVERITVVPNGTPQPPEDYHPDPEVVERLGHHHDRIKLLVIGHDTPRKNLAEIPVIGARLRAAGRAVSVLRVGRDWTPKLLEAIRHELGGEALEDFTDVDDNALRTLFALADVYITPSLFEGFGLPVLEAMAHGCPVVSSNATSLPEAGGEAALYFDPQDTEAAAARVLEIVDNPAKRDALVAAGRARAASMTWDRTLDGFLDVYRKLLDRNCIDSR